MLQLYDSRTQHTLPFQPLHEANVSLYTCGITPNNATHLGHAFTYASVDVLVRHLTHLGYRVDYLQNATDINDSDDVIKQAQEAGKTWREIADMWIEHFHVQIKALNIAAPNSYVLATSAIPTIIAITKELLEKGYAYDVDGSIFFDVTKTPDYGAMCRLSPDQMVTVSRERGANPEDPRKRNPLDFLLWTAASEEPLWDTPWGRGRPGWHIECSAMIYDRFGAQIDIHAGGADLIYPHHESEIVQTESYTQTQPYVGYWMHVAMVRYEGEKMSKSLGNLVLVADLLKTYEPNVVRTMLLSHHYRESWEYGKSQIQAAQTRWTNLTSQLQHEDTGSFEDVVTLLSQDLQTHKVLDLCMNMAGRPLQQTLTHLGFVL